MLDAFLKEVDDAVINLCGNKTCWYRGHGDATYKLHPSILRLEKKCNEPELFYSYKTHASSLNGINKTNWELLQDMQHYGLPTRLLDWTSCLGTALFFAVIGQPVSPCVWILRPHTLNKKSTGHACIYDTSSIPDIAGNNLPDYSVSNILTGNSKIDLPFAIQPPHGNNRIAAQRGMFTVHCNNSLPIEETCPEMVRKILIPCELVESIKRYLSCLGVDDFSLFPDHQGLSNYLLNKYVK
ncbi:FRG domain-containing protein [Photobacterium nomapromontoriensis]|uniref:FRG domain-containing protein n=1 Tax=Photobacterium nomapromontoriensis TaxID=2910237 RepID=UPI003D0E8069